MSRNKLSFALRRRLLAVSGLFLLVAFVAIIPRHTISAAADSANSPELFSAVMQRLWAQPESRDRMLAEIRDVPKFGEFLSPDLVDRLRVLILGKQWQRVDHFPALTIGALNKSVDTAAGLAGQSAKPLEPAELLDTAEYSLGQAESIDMDHPATAPSYADDPDTMPKQIGFNLTMGDGPDPQLAPMHAESRQLAAVLNRLAMNAAQMPEAVAALDGKRFNDGADLVRELIVSGHRVITTDDTYFANFGHLHDGNREVIMPFWVDTQIAVPASHRSLLLPVNHSEQELHIRGPKWNADVSFYYGIDGKAEFRTMDSLNQSWVMHRAINTFKDPTDIAHILRLLSSAARVYYAVRMAHPELPFGGYYRLGVCQDVGAAVEFDLRGSTVLFPITHDRAYFPRTLSNDPRDEEFLAAFAQIPSDRGAGLPPVARALGGLPTVDFDAIMIPGLASDLHRVAIARRFGLTQRTHPLLTATIILIALVVLFVLAVRWLWQLARSRHSSAVT